MADPKPKDIGRGNFGRLALIGIGALLFNPYVKEVVVEPLVSARNKIVTPDATYYPVYEHHDAHPDMSEIILESNNDPLIYFRECIIKPGAIRNTNQVLLTMNYIDGAGLGNVYGTLVTPDEINAMYEKKASLSIEGLVFNPKRVQADFKKVEDDYKMHLRIAETTIGGNLVKKISGEKITDWNVLENIASVLALGWASNFRLVEIANELDKLPIDHRMDDVKNALNNLSGFISHLHPENMTIFFRNLYGARRMQVLAKDAKERNKDSNPGIISDYGAAHRGINDLLILGPKVTLSGFSLYSDEILREIVKDNGGINEFCKILAIPIKGTDVKDSNEKQFVFDRELKEYLEKRLGKDNA